MIYKLSIKCLNLYKNPMCLLKAIAVRIEQSMEDIFIGSYDAKQINAVYGGRITYPHESCTYLRNMIITLH